MKLFNVKAGVLSGVAATLLATAPAQSQDSQWANQSFLTDYSTLKPIPGKEGKDYQYLVPDIESSAGKISKVMLDQPEIFLSPNSPYKGAQPADLAAIAGAVYSQVETALKARGYKMVDKPGPDTLYVRLGVTDLQIAKKKRGLLAYTPVGFVVDVGVKALQDFMTKYDLLDMSLQTEIQDSASQKVIAAAVLQRGKTAGANEADSIRHARGGDEGVRRAIRLQARQRSRGRCPAHRLHRSSHAQGTTERHRSATVA